MDGLTEHPNRLLTREANLIPGSKQRSDSPAMEAHLNQQMTPLGKRSVVGREEEGEARGRGRELSWLASKVCYSQATLIFGATKAIPLGETIFLFIVVALPKEP